MQKIISRKEKQLLVTPDCHECDYSELENMWGKKSLLCKNSPWRNLMSEWVKVLAKVLWGLLHESAVLGADSWEGVITDMSTC